MWQKNIDASYDKVKLEAKDIKNFINFLVDIDYNGSVRAEPFNKVLSSMDDENAVKKTYDYINQSIKI